MPAVVVVLLTAEQWEVRAILTQKGATEMAMHASSEAGEPQPRVTSHAVDLQVAGAAA